MGVKKQMRKSLWIIFTILTLVMLAACGGNDVADDLDDDGELIPLEVDFDLPETADVDEAVELKATVTYGDEQVEDAEYVEFEYWLSGDKDNSVSVDAENNEDGTYTAEVTFEEDGVYEIYAHTQARDLHTMPKKSIAIGDAEIPEDDDQGDHEHVEGFNMHFMEPEDATANEETTLMVHLQMHDEALEDVEVRFEVWKEDSDDHEWVDAEETTAGEYTATHTFEEAATYHIQIHVEDDEDLHEYEEHTFEINE